VLHDHHAPGPVGLVTGLVVESSSSTHSVAVLRLTSLGVGQGEAVPPDGMTPAADVAGGEEAFLAQQDWFDECDIQRLVAAPSGGEGSDPATGLLVVVGNRGSMAVAAVSVVVRPTNARFPLASCGASRKVRGALQYR